jgi:hypothetical protein
MNRVMMHLARGRRFSSLLKKGAPNNAAQRVDAFSPAFSPLLDQEGREFLVRSA